MKRTLLALFLLTCAAGADAGVDLRWEAHWSSLGFGQAGSVSLMIDAAQPLRTVEVWIDYDPAVVEGLNAVPGSLFDGVPCFLWQGYDEPAPGQWHGYVVIIGGDCSITGPGELLRWTFETGYVTGFTRLETDQVDLYDPAANLLPDVALGAATIAVSLTPTAVRVAPPLSLGLAPNPFNPRTRITLDLPAGLSARLEVRDLRGRLLDVPWQGEGGPGPLLIDWDPDGLASGPYLLRLSTADGRVRTVRATLLR